jgi:hypothetical protein
VCCKSANFYIVLFEGSLKFLKSLWVSKELFGVTVILTRISACTDFNRVNAERGNDFKCLVKRLRAVKVS